MVYVPSATYRLQVSPKLKLRDIKKLIPYFHSLGVSTLYFAPLFCARPGSEHGYDVTNPLQLNPEVGTLEELEEISALLKEHDMGLLQDIVPNHMAFHPNNGWLMDVFEKGPKSEFYTFFDINFQHPDFKGKIMVPFLGEPLQKVLEARQLKLAFGETGFSLQYFDSKYPLSIESYEKLLQNVAAKTSDVKAKSAFASDVDKLLKSASASKVAKDEWAEAKAILYKNIQHHKAIKQALVQLLESINKDPQTLQQLHDAQHFILCHWQETEKRINYRRFFTVNELICLSMERPEVFSKYHELIKKLTDKGIFQGLRVDHVDGLFDPDSYLEKLRKLAGDETYLVVEKILEGEENLPDYWPIQGNSGYDFLAWVSNLYTDAEGERKLTRLYKKIVPDAATDYDKLVFEKKMFILKTQMPGELENLLKLLQETSLIPTGEDENTWRNALGILLASFPVYRIYTRQFPLSELAEEVIAHAFKEAEKRGPEHKEKLQHLRTLFIHENQDSEQRLQYKLYFVMRSQQFTGPLAAKGVEDTTFYNYNRLISLNEVGNSPELFHLRRRDFHELMQHKLSTYPHSLNATATHDTKRGEGSRMRLEVLSELPDEWEEQVQNWLEIVRKHPAAKTLTANDLYFILQTLVGVMPLEGTVDETLVERVQEYLIKAFREAKVSTNWISPNNEYEQAAKDLVAHLLQEKGEFLAAFLPFFFKLSHYGWLYSLCQTMLKLSSPGVPDIYQGCELWDFSLVDPDNRRPVDYELRQSFLDELKQLDKKESIKLHQQLLQNPADARAKLYLIWKVLTLRKTQKAIFDHGNYQPLTITGKYKNNAMAFARAYEGSWYLVVVPRLLTQVISENELPLGQQVWQDTAVTLPAEAPKQWENIFGETSITGQDSLPLAAILQTYPVALLTATTA
ncbi:malto-oligosyltrehalose synthase [Pontibacter vulgaris]|uniref:malto-oligosyltrehalose synthase n=1 Tax=Pontibacter vulgaris TaxID=2905679 RepID=UPI001FA7E1BA|nr:malto-oligosyltrehalose synthase [Pontibacter vulgaris]